MGPRSPVRARITGPGSGTDPALIERLTAQLLNGDPVPDDLAARPKADPTTWWPSCSHRPGTATGRRSQQEQSHRDFLYLNYSHPGHEPGI